MSIFVVDVEADGPIPGLYSMVSFGAVLLDDTTQTFYGKTKPMSDSWLPEALAVSGHSREEHLTFENPGPVMVEFAKWIESVNKNGRPIFVSDNNGFDWQWINYYFHYYLDRNPFGFSSRRIGDIYSGATGNLRAGSEWKKFRKTKHSHNPVDDALGNAEALIEIIKRYKL